MDKKLIIFLVVAVIILAIVTIFASNLFLKEKPPVIEKLPEEITPPPATGNVDDAVNALLEEVADIEPLLVAEEDSDALLVGGDSQEVGDFGQSVNENEF